MTEFEEGTLLFKITLLGLLLVQTSFLDSLKLYPALLAFSVPRIPLETC